MRGRAEPADTVLVVALVLVAALVVTPGLGDGETARPARFVAGGARGISLVDARSGRTVGQLGDVPSEGGGLAVSKDGAVYFGEHPTRPVCISVAKRLWMIQRGREPTRVAVGEAPVVDPTGRRVAFAVGDCTTRTIGVGLLDPTTRRAHDVPLEWPPNVSAVAPEAWRDGAHLYAAAQLGEDEIAHYRVDIAEASMRRLSTPELDRYDSTAAIGNAGTDGKVPVLARTEGLGTYLLFTDLSLRHPERVLTYPSDVLSATIDTTHRNVLYLQDRGTEPGVDLFRWHIGDAHPTLVEGRTDYSTVAWVPD